MKNKLIALLTLLAVPSVAFAAGGFAERSYSDYYNWLYPAYLYHLKIWIGFLIGFAVIYLIIKKQLNPIISSCCNYFVLHPTLAIIICGVPSLALVGLWGAYSIIPLFNMFGILFLIMGTIPILLVNRHFRNRVLLSPIYLISVYLLILSALGARFLLIKMTNSGIFQFSQMTYSDFAWGFRSHPYDSVASIWRAATISPFIILHTLLLLWIGNASRWLKSKIKQRVTLQKFD